MTAQFRVLYIDDEIPNLINFQSLFRKAHQVFVAQSVNEARLILTQHPNIHVVFSDQRMPDMMGTDFFEEIRVTHPLIIRILVTGFADLNTSIHAINKGQVFRYIQKPWKTEDVEQALLDASKEYLRLTYFQTRNEELESAYQALENYADHISHDIRGPLSGIQTISQLAANSHSIEELNEILLLIESTSAQLSQYTADLQHFYRVQRGKIALKTTDMALLVQEIKAVYQAPISAAGITFQIKNEVDQPVPTDPTALKLIIHNLISNAVKYQQPEHSEPWIHVHLFLKTSILYIEVSDGGIGMKPDQLAQIFTRFYQSDPTKEGYGVGLFHAQQMATKLNGRLSATSTYLKGSAFLLEIPVSL
ncbi:hybrid sensor histidine kinase/response regulator [Olivibacter sp. XZL3]|uniref:hybrid sensor histidine kinase/response regulator n=1 Tax=Olivibacter sp. XZL3 TaxID=1735116 RepID=UPI0010659CFE|nr:hybrid sensor histidine kinase/response regulator [Olivibacter sp. XZL3]